jgi:hypothetical protein
MVLYHDVFANFVVAENCGPVHLLRLQLQSRCGGKDIKEFDLTTQIAATDPE